MHHDFLGEKLGKIDFSGIDGLFVHVWGIQSRRK